MKASYCRGHHWPGCRVEHLEKLRKVAVHREARRHLKRATTEAGVMIRFLQTLEHRSNEAARCRRIARRQMTGYAIGQPLRDPAHIECRRGQAVRSRNRTHGA